MSNLDLLSPRDLTKLASQMQRLAECKTKHLQELAPITRDLSALMATFRATYPGWRHEGDALAETPLRPTPPAGYASADPATPVETVTPAAVAISVSVRQRDALVAGLLLLGHYVCGRCQVVDGEMGQISKAGMEAVHLAWAPVRPRTEARAPLNNVNIGALREVVASWPTR